MRKFILIMAMVLASASAQAGDRSLSMGGGEALPAAASNAVNASGKVAEAPVAPVVEPPPKPPETPKYVERPAAAPAPASVSAPQVQPAVQQAGVQPSATTAEPATTEKRPIARRSGNRHHARRWTESRIIGELHRHGIY